MFTNDCCEKSGFKENNCIFIVRLGCINNGKLQMLLFMRKISSNKILGKISKPIIKIWKCAFLRTLYFLFFLNVYTKWDVYLNCSFIVLKINTNIQETSSFLFPHENFTIHQNFTPIHHTVQSVTEVHTFMHQLA